MVFANAGVGETTNYFKETFDEAGQLLEPPSDLLDVNLKGMLNVIKLSWFSMKRQGTGGSIVITTSGTAYVPWQSLAVYSSVKLAASHMEGSETMNSIESRCANLAFPLSSSVWYDLYDPSSSATKSPSTPLHRARRSPSSCPPTLPNRSRPWELPSAPHTPSLSHSSIPLPRNKRDESKATAKIRKSTMREKGRGTAGSFSSWESSSRKLKSHMRICGMRGWEGRMQDYTGCNKQQQMVETQSNLLLPVGVGFMRLVNRYMMSEDLR